MWIHYSQKFPWKKPLKLLIVFSRYRHIESFNKNEFRQLGSTLASTSLAFQEKQSLKDYHTQVKPMPQGVTNCIQNIEIYSSKFLEYVKFLGAVQKFVRLYNILLLSFVYSELCFVRWLKINLFFCLSQYLTLLNVPLIFLKI